MSAPQGTRIPSSLLSNNLSRWEALIKAVYIDAVLLKRVRKVEVGMSKEDL